jgi:hypothetical protein
MLVVRRFGTTIGDIKKNAKVQGDIVGVGVGAGCGA